MNNQSTKDKDAISTNGMAATSHPLATEEAIRILKRKLQKEGFFKIMKMKSTYEKPSERKKRVQTENIKRIKKLQKLKNRY